MVHRILALCLWPVAFLVHAPAYGGVAFGAHQFSGRSACEASGKFSREICRAAESNAAAEFEEKAPHFPNRASCEQVYRPGGCALSLRQSAGVATAKSGVSFTPRQQGFRIVARSDNDVSTIPLSPGLTFATRTALRPATSINPRNAGMAAPRPAYGGAGGAGGGGQTFGVSEPDGAKGAAPPPVPFDPNFDCSAYVEPSAKGDANTACAPMRRR